MGRGDKKTKRGKIFSGSFGKLRPAKSVKKVVKKVAVAKKAEPAPAAPSKKKTS